jgi:fibronectin type 3 domain-containing protein
MASPGGATCTSTTLGCAIGGLSNGTSYSFTVIATNAMGSSPASNALSATPVQVPNPPQLISATAGNAQVDLAWTAPANDGGSPITGYTATASPGGATCSTATLGCTIGGLTNGIAYSFTVTATSSLGTSAPSNTMTATPATVPNAPTLNTATAGNGKVVMAWAAPTSNGGRPITGYTATASPGGATCSTTSLGCTITGLTNGTTYTVSVTAKNVIGSGPASNALTATPVTVPGAPTLTGAAAGDSQISLTWTAPGSNGGSAITGYTVTATPGGFTCATPTLGCTIGGLTNGTSYTFKATATNAIGTSAPSNSLSQTPGKPPSAPNLTGATAGNAQVALTWTAPASNGGKQITGYRIYRGTSSATKAAVGTTGNVTSYTDTGRVNGTTYFYEVAAINAMGEGAHSNERSATPITSPSAPQNFTATTSAIAGVDLAWGVPASNGGSPILAYRIYRGTTSTNRTFLISLTPTTSYTDTTTTPGVRYSYAIAAYNAAGTGLWAPEKFAVAK